MNNYLNSPRQYAFDLTEAANAEDWERYKNVQAELAAETTLQVLNSAKAAEQGKKAAVLAVSETIPGFDRLYGSEEWTEALKSRPKLAEAIESAESTLGLQDNLQDFYRVGFDVYLARQARQGQSPQRQPQRLRTENTPSGLTEQEIFSGTEQSKRVDLSSKNRRALIEQLESSGVADVEF